MTRGPPVVAVVSHAGDDHVPPVVDALRALGARPVLVDLAAFPARARVSLPYGAARGRPVLHLDGDDLRLDAVSAVWWRRPQPLEADPALSGPHAEFACRQAEEALHAVAGALDARWVNDPWRDAAASHKPAQLAAAARAGLAVPRTLVTSDPGRAAAFLAAVRGPCVHKALHATPDDWHPTRTVGPDDLARLDALRLAPVVLQEYVPGVDVRVTVAGRSTFAAEIDARATRSPEDFRPVFDDARVAPCALPAAVARRLRALVSGLGLRYAAVDLRRRDDGEHVFLEANPSGQWLFVERRTGQPITAAVARLLAGR